MSKFSFFRSIEGLIFLIGCCLLAIEVILFGKVPQGRLAHKTLD